MYLTDMIGRLASLFFPCLSVAYCPIIETIAVNTHDAWMCHHKCAETGDGKREKRERSGRKENEGAESIAVVVIK